MIEKVYSPGALDYYGFDKDAQDGVGKIIESKGFKYQQGMFGGIGEVEAITQFLAHLNFTTQGALTDVTIGVISNAAYDVIKALRKWWKKNNKVENHVPGIVIYIYTGENSTSFKVRLSSTIGDIERHIKLSKLSSKKMKRLTDKL